jgi:hypothetical protein
MSPEPRYALREGQGTSEPEKVSYIKPLSSEQMKVILEFVVKSAQTETEMKRSMYTNWIAIIAAVISACTAIFVAILKK